MYTASSHSYWVMMGFTAQSASYANNNVFNAQASFSNSLHYFLLHQSLSCLVSTDAKYFTKNFYLSKSFWVKFFLLNKLEVPHNLPIIVDGAQYTPNAITWVIQFNLASMLLDNRVSVHTVVSPKDFSLSSLSVVYHSCIWLERELSDFTNINFVGLTDTRRLLLDYFEKKASWQTHISNDKNFNNVIYDISLSY